MRDIFNFELDCVIYVVQEVGGYPISILQQDSIK